ncbi:MAG: hypothetical protein RLZZ494_2493, partial [Pseudomonadota bacterium]
MFSFKSIVAALSTPFVAIILVAFLSIGGTASAEPYAGPLFDAHLHYNEEA